MLKFYQSKDLMKILSVSAVTLHSWRVRGVGPIWTKSAGMYRYPANQFRDYLENLTGGGPVSQNLDDDEKRKFFAAAHRAERLPDDGPSRAELAERLALVEINLAKLTKEKTYDHTQ